MTSLKDSWQQQRQQRQQIVTQRQKLVSHSLAIVRHERQTEAAQLRDDLSLFREGLASSDLARRRNYQTFRAELQQFCVTLHHETQAFLAAARDRRQAEAHQLAQRLDQFVQILQHQTAAFLRLTAAARTEMSQQLTQDLQTFHCSLSATVASLRQDLQAEIAALKADTQLLLAQNQQQRSQMHQQTLSDLIIFMEVLRSSVQSQLSDLSRLRHDRAVQLRQDLMQSRVDRTAEVQAMFRQLAEFRTELHSFRQTLHRTVWGNPAAIAPAAEAATATPVLAKELKKDKKDNGLSKPRPVIMIKPVPVATPPQNVQPETQIPAVAYEKEIYNYIHKALGARLPEIEAALGVNRFEAVDALRSLIKKGLVTQHDRVYKIGSI